MVPMMYDGLFYALGVRFPTLRLRFDAGVAPSSLRIVFNDVPEAEVEARVDGVLAGERASVLRERGFAAEPAVNPATGADSAWIPASEAEAAHDAGATIWDTQDLLILLLGSVLQRKAANFVAITETRAMLQQVASVFPLLVAETVPKAVSEFVLTDVLRRLVAESVSIRDLRRILMALTEWGRTEHDPLLLAEYARAALKRQITHQMTRGSRQMVVFLLDPALEDEVRTSLTHTATGSYLDLEPDRLRRIAGAIRDAMATLPNDAQMPQILTTMEIRSAVRRLVAPSMPWLHVVSYQDLRPDVHIQPVGRIALDGLSRRAQVTVDGRPLWTDLP
jgi:type III secretion protein V